MLLSLISLACILLPVYMIPLHFWCFKWEYWWCHMWWHHNKCSIGHTFSQLCIVSSHSMCNNSSLQGFESNSGTVCYRCTDSKDTYNKSCALNCHHISPAVFAAGSEEKAMEYSSKAANTTCICLCIDVDALVELFLQKVWRKVFKFFTFFTQFAFLLYMSIMLTILLFQIGAALFLENGNIRWSQNTLSMWEQQKTKNHGHSSGNTTSYNKSCWLTTSGKEYYS